jgi:hypothetical protein
MGVRAGKAVTTFTAADDTLEKPWAALTAVQSPIVHSPLLGKVPHLRLYDCGTAGASRVFPFVTWVIDDILDGGLMPLVCALAGRDVL